MPNLTNYLPEKTGSSRITFMIVIRVDLWKDINNTIKVIKRRCYGILDVKHLFQRIYLDLEGHSVFTL